MTFLTTMRTKLILLSIICFFATSCSESVDRDFPPYQEIFITFVNGSDIPITILNSNRYIIAALKPGDSITVSQPSILSASIESILYFAHVRNGYIIFEPIGEVDFVSIPSLSLKHLFEEESYTVTEYNTYSKVYQYTFVNSDYEFALANGKKI